mmetsp:Transcript_24720/g.73177  ORF Transcript_24720/g.73177 Transcript_24720/m.73177 type:complete len:118 (-) Transcript_24720:21-374(-)
MLFLNGAVVMATASWTMMRGVGSRLVVQSSVVAWQAQCVQLQIAASYFYTYLLTIARVAVLMSQVSPKQPCCYVELLSPVAPPPQTCFASLVFLIRTYLQCHGTGPLGFWYCFGFML